jgi:hypothetical protein
MRDAEHGRKTMMNEDHMNQNTDILHEARKLRLLAAALELQHFTRGAANIVPVTGTDRVIAIGTPAQVRALLVAAPIAAAPAAEEVQWISVDKQLPALGEEVLIWCGYRICGYRSDDKNDPENHEGWVIDFDNGNAKAITHWMPLPAAPAMKRPASTEGGAA